jgi:hypothetical protein
MTFSLAYIKPNDLEKTIIVARVSNVLYDHQHACLCFSSPLPSHCRHRFGGD